MIETGIPCLATILFRYNLANLSKVQNLPDLEIPPENAYIILETDGCMEGWGGIVKWKKSKGDSRSSEKNCAYASGKFSTPHSQIAVKSKRMHQHSKKFADAVTGTGVKINIEHIERKHNTLVDSLSRLVNLCFAECTREMKQLAAAALYSVEEVLQSPNAFQKNMKITCEEILKISNHFQESSQKLSLHMKNQEHYTDIISSRPTKFQSEWINLMHGDQSPKTLNFQQQKKQSKPCEVYKQSYNAKPKSVLECQQKTTTGLTRENTSEFKTKKQEESSLNWKPLPNEWAATTSKPKEVQTNNLEDNMFRYNRK
ncbi:hypothetical protein Tco_0369933 [Tanacetum coccineum]